MKKFPQFTLTRKFHPFFNPIRRFSLTPCFSWVWKHCEKKNRFNGLSHPVETVETVPTSASWIPTQLKQGVNERDFELRSKGYEISALKTELRTKRPLAQGAVSSCARNFRALCFGIGVVFSFFFLEINGASAPVSSTNSPTEKSGELLELLDGSALHGRLRSIDSEKGLSWEHAGAKQPIEFKPENLAWIRFSSAEKSELKNSESTCQFRFANGDEFFGNLLSMDENELELQTWFGGKFKTPRALVRSLRFIPKGVTAIYEGPTGLEGWQLGKNLNSPGWEYLDGSFIGNSLGTIGRDLKLPDASRLEFDLAWNAPFTLLFSYYTGAFDGFNYSSSSYMFYLAPGTISLQRINAGVGTTTIGRSEPVAAMLAKKKAHLEFRANKEESFIEVLVDGKTVNQWKDQAGWVAKGSGILFYAQTEGAGMKISNLKVSEWDGRPGSEIATNALSREDQIYLVNHDKVSGKVTRLRDGKLQFAAAETSLDIPLSRVTQIFFANADTNSIAPSPWEIQASVSGGGTISFALEKWNNEKVFGQNKNFGKISLNPQSIRQIQFNPGKPKLASDEIDSANDLIWEGDEP